MHILNYRSYDRLLQGLRGSNVFWQIARWASIFVPSRIFRNVPDKIIVELTNFCNLRCPTCPTYHAMQRERGFMKLELFKKLIDEFEHLDKKPDISMDFAGEPLLHKQIDQFVAYASARGHYTYIGTNATQLTEDISSKLIEAGLGGICVAVDGATKEAHEAYRQGSDFNAVRKNVENFIRIRQNLHQRRPNVIVQTLLTSLSDSQIDNVASWAKTIGAETLFTKPFSLGSHTTESQRAQYSYLLPKDSKHRIKTSRVYKTLCTLPLNDAVVFFNGDLGVCCVDFNGTMSQIKANISESSFLKQFNSREFIKARKQGLLKKYILCQTCIFGDREFSGAEYDLT